jgi:diguanylate cyclase (GGDEF)-like protein/PAS domain S-box-containing protein
MNNNARRRRPRVLIADDDPLIGTLATETLQQSGSDVTIVSDGNVLLAAFDRCRPDVLLLDVEMPGSDGFELCAQIRKRPGGAHIPIVMVTGHDDTESIARAYAAGATDFIVKPIHWPVLPYRLGFMMRANETTRDLRRSEQRNNALLEAFPDWMLVINAQGRVLERISGSAEATGGLLAGETIEEIVPTDTARKARECMQAAAGTGRPQNFEFEFGANDKQKIYEVRLQYQSDSTFLFVVRDVTERRRTEARIQYLAYYDTLTGLPNRQLFVRELRRAIRASERKKSRMAILFIDLDRFKRINDTLGHAVGDALLQSVARRLETCVRPADFIARAAPDDDQAFARIARLGGDEFVLLLTDIQSQDQITTVATRVRHALAEPFTSEGHQFVVTPSIGISQYPEDGTEIEDLLVKADMAMYEAKDQGRNQHAFARNAKGGILLDRLDLENDLHHAIGTSELTLHYQPKVDAHTGAVISAEALLRWNHPKRGWIAPGTFIPLAEETGIMLRLGDWVIHEACRQISAWAGGHLGNLCVSANVSTIQFARADFVDSVLRAVQQHGIKPQQLELEITESLLMRDLNEVISSLRRLREIGIRVSIDDFGTGYSSLGYLKQFPVDSLKIDRSFVKDLLVSSDDAAICSAIIAMARELKLTTVAEGVEVVEQLEFLRRQGCDQIQGFLFSKPLPPAQLADLLRDSPNLTIKTPASKTTA